MDDRPSRTSSLVAFLRAANTAGVTRVRGFADPYAARLLPPAAALAARALGRLVRGRPAVARALVERSGGMFDLVALRSRFIDESWAEARRAGARQLVLLGAGLDARAHRLPEMDGVRVFEVDHPATQAYKRRRAAGLPLAAEAVAYVAVDFNRDRLADALRRAGLDAAAPSFWVWEGVIPYLPEEATAATLAQVAELAAPGSRLCATYIVPDSSSTEIAATRALVGRAWREPWLGLLPRERMAELLGRAGFAVASDTGVDDWVRAYSDAAPGLEARFHERIALAERRG